MSVEVMIIGFGRYYPDLDPHLDYPSADLERLSAGDPITDIIMTTSSNSASESLARAFGFDIDSIERYCISNDVARRCDHRVLIDEAGIPPEYVGYFDAFCAHG